MSKEEILQVFVTEGPCSRKYAFDRAEHQTSGYTFYNLVRDGLLEEVGSHWRNRHQKTRDYRITEKGRQFLRREVLEYPRGKLLAFS